MTDQSEVISATSEMASEATAATSSNNSDNSSASITATSTAASATNDPTAPSSTISEAATDTQTSTASNWDSTTTNIDSDATPSMATGSASLANSVTSQTTAQANSATSTTVDDQSKLHNSDAEQYIAGERSNTSAAEYIPVVGSISSYINDQGQNEYDIPTGLSDDVLAQWIANVKEQATTDYNNTGVAQVITMKDASVDTWTIGDSSRPTVDAVDISSYQSGLTQANFNRLKSLGVKTVIVKLTENTNYTNPYARSQIQMARNAGLTVEVYHYAKFATAIAAANEARHLGNVMRSLGLGGNIRVFADMEDRSTYSSNIAANLNKFWSVLSSYGYTNHGVYTYVSYKYRDAVIRTVGASKTWMAQYPYSPSSNNLWNTGYGAWQFSSTAMLPGYSGYLDVSVDYDNLLTGKSYATITSTTSVNYKAKISTQDGTRNDGLYVYGPYDTSAATAKPNSTVSRYENWEVNVSLISKTSNGVSYAKVTSLDGKHTWWVDTRALSYVIISTQQVNKLAMMSTQNGTRNDGLYLYGPYDTSATTKTPNSTVSRYDNLKVTISMIVNASNGASYAKVTSLDGKHTWWVDTQALNDIILNTTSVKYVTTMSTQNGTRNDGLYLDGPYNTNAATKMPNSTVSRYENWGVTVSLIEKTSGGASYAKVTSLDGKHTWWVDTRALNNVILSTTTVNYTATLSTRNGTRNDGLYLYGPYNTSATTKVPNSTVSRYENWGVIVGKIEKTSSGFSYAEVTSLDGKHTWWVDVRALMSV
ncbi:hypothetical protein LC20001_05575 [Loigolactobacillus coryniformis subsp. coryniformis KCTC 3167 = DSM 20001]|uniref:GW dipeptide domain-containing protein n=1 Tax=Loigolactobacillus coryniformis TaxID=1610 RepID=UPI0006830C89|nr:GW dipeptide domain-containing protein [Loigolactobacillus coryniformis]ATO55132.1 hypothetical protein LC20001_05575 [Loigolactobacillus coryniformis subsp. coryniformis KCTC 3167 = DSM 20001]